MNNSKRLNDIPLTIYRLGLAFSVVLFLALLPASAFASANWPNEPAGATEYVDCPFSNSICSPLISQYKSETYATSDGPLSPPYVLDDHLAAGASTGGGSWGTESLPFPKEIYLGAWWSTNADFVGSCNNTNKMIFVKNSVMDNNFLVWQKSPTQGGLGEIKWYNQATYDNCGHPGEYGMCYSQGDGTGWFNPNTADAGRATVGPGSGWHRIELYLKSSTSKTSRDGVVRWWVDGFLVGNYPMVNLTPGGFRETYINHTWDGSGCLLPPARDMSKAWHHYWDHLRISFPNGAPDPILPLAITSPLRTSARVGGFYADTLGAENGKAPYGWTISVGSLPPGVTLNKTSGILSGIPTVVGRSDFTVKVMDSSVPAKEATKAFTIIASQSAGIAGKESVLINGSQITAEQGKTRVTFRGVHSLTVYDLSGRAMWRHAGIGEAVWNHGGNLKNGVYLAKVPQGRKASTARFNVMN